MKKVQFKQLFINELSAKGIEINVDAIKSALDKTARHAAAKYGFVNWGMEYGEAGVRNALYFYGEFGVQDTFNRQGYQQSRKTA